MLSPAQHYYISALITSIAAFVFGIFVLAKSPNRRLAHHFAWYAYAIAHWSFFVFACTSVTNHEWSYVLAQICHFIGVFIPVAFLHFVVVLVKNNSRSLIRIIKVSYAAVGAISLAILIKPRLFITDVVPKLTFNYFPEPGPLFYVWNSLFVILVVISSAVLLTEALKKSAIEKGRLISFLTANSLGYLGGIGCFFPVYGINLFPFPYGIWGVFFFVCVTFYAVLRYQFIDIEVIIKKTLVFAGIVAAAVSIVAFPFALIQAVIGKAFGVPDPFILMALGIATAVLIYRPVERVLVDMTDRYLFQKRHEIKVILKNLSEKVVTVLDLSQVGKTILSTLEEAFRLESGMMFIRDKKAEKYRLLEYFGLEPEEFANGVKRYFDQPDIDGYFANHKSTLMLDHLDAARLPDDVGGWLKAVKARVCVPLLIDEDLTGILMLGKKKSDQEFSQEEIDIFPTIESQVSLAIRNARLIETVVEEREAKIKAEHAAQRIKFAGTIKHEQKNSLAGMESPARFLSMYHVPDLKKAFKESDGEWFMEICEKIDKVSQDITKGIDKVLDIAEASLGGMETGEQPFRKMSFKVIWEDAGESSGVKGCDYEITIPDGFAVYVRYGPFERVFENLIINANDAMKDQDQKLIQLNCSYSEIGGKQVAYFEFKDNGPGIPKEIHGKIFLQGFSTKPKPDDTNLLATGYGEGLYVCKNNIENIHHGKIWVESELGKGATFKFWIPTRENG